MIGFDWILIGSALLKHRESWGLLFRLFSFSWLWSSRKFPLPTTFSRPLAQSSFSSFFLSFRFSFCLCVFVFLNNLLFCLVRNSSKQAIFLSTALFISLLLYDNVRRPDLRTLRKWWRREQGPPAILPSILLLLFLLLISRPVRFSKLGEKLMPMS